MHTSEKQEFDVRDENSSGRGPSRLSALCYSTMSLSAHRVVTLFFWDPKMSLVGVREKNGGHPERAPIASLA